MSRELIIGQGKALNGKKAHEAMNQKKSDLLIENSQNRLRQAFAPTESAKNIKDIEIRKLVLKEKLALQNNLSY